MYDKGQSASKLMELYAIFYWTLAIDKLCNFLRYNNKSNFWASDELLYFKFVNHQMSSANVSRAKVIAVIV